ncbi:Probable RNA-directed DNA polymerase from transposon X-element [Eumeta japonica]|uniref:Probable RNA-directed DNA polymerase from transposon X-element n=1 Tax=Eumeta variegata TaxID=151549 RepID=A0A4C2ABS6_EUMVA|nr:Probable RNA-directed DNA polymerase from transposon X-element [Eumeta japonica]
MMIELPRVAVRILLFIFNAMLRLEYFPNNWKVAVVKMIPKPGKDLTKAESYRPISLLPTMSKLFEKLLVTKLSPILAERNCIPDIINLALDDNMVPLNKRIDWFKS